MGTDSRIVAAKKEEGAAFCREHLKGCCQELVDFHATGVLAKDGRVRQLIEILSFAGFSAMPMATEMIKTAALEEIIRPQPPVQEPPTLPSWADSLPAHHWLRDMSLPEIARTLKEEARVMAEGEAVFAAVYAKMGPGIVDWFKNKFALRIRLLAELLEQAATSPPPCSVSPYRPCPKCKSRRTCHVTTSPGKWRTVCCSCGLEGPVCSGADPYEAGADEAWNKMVQEGAFLEGAERMPATVGDQVLYYPAAEDGPDADVYRIKRIVNLNGEKMACLTYPSGCEKPSLVPLSSLRRI